MQTNLLRCAHFSLAAHTCRQLPADKGIEIAFAGRSNAGKSSAINKLSEQKQLARASRTPGRTQQMVVFTLADEAHRVIDLPGYGYAKVPQAMRAHWQQEIDTYLRRRQSLRAVVLIADIRHPLKAFDQQMLRFCAASDLSCLLLLTKADKLARSKMQEQVKAARTWCQEAHIEARVEAFSVLNHTGVEVARSVIAEWFADDAA